jgi:hypothetical protein
MSTAIEQEVSALLGDLTAVKAKAARADAIAEKVRHENNYLQQQVQLQMSSCHRGAMEQQRLQELLQRAQRELGELQRREQLSQQHQEASVPVTLHNALQHRAATVMLRAHNFVRWRRMFRLWSACK